MESVPEAAVLLETMLTGRQIFISLWLSLHVISTEDKRIAIMKKTSDVDAACFLGLNKVIDG